MGQCKADDKEILRAGNGRGLLEIESDFAGLAGCNRTERHFPALNGFAVLLKGPGGANKT